MAHATRVVPRDDRAWPRGAVLVSVMFGLAAVGTGVGLVAGAAGRGSWVMALVTISFVVAFGSGFAVVTSALRHWVDGHPVPGRFHLLESAGVLVPLVVVVVDGLVGGAMLAGFIGGFLVGNAWTVRAARANRDRVDEAEAASARDQAPARDAPTVPVDVGAETGHVAPVGQVLRDTVALERQRLLAWLVAGAGGTAASNVLDAPAIFTIAVACMGGLAIVWVLRRLSAVWLALRDFTRAATPPRRACVVLLHDPAPRMIRPLLGVWSEPPVPRAGRLPKPERVYRCDDERAALECHQGSVVVHEAWVDTGPRRRSKPRWVAADAGIALPHRRSLLGRWYMSALIGGERPEQPQPLTLQPPHPDTEVTVELGRDVGSFPVALAGRLAGLAAFGLLCYWLT